MYLIEWKIGTETNGGRHDSGVGIGSGELGSGSITWRTVRMKEHRQILS